MTDTTTEKFVGERGDIDAVLGLKQEKIEYQKLVQKVAFYVSTKVKIGTHIEPLIFKAEDPKAIHAKRVKPKKLSATDKADEDLYLE